MPDKPNKIEPLIIPLWPDGAPGSEDWTHQEQAYYSPPPLGFNQVRNVVVPTLTAYFPQNWQPGSTAIIICPGGGFHALAIDHEGNEVARWFQARGVAAFVLKYRLVQTLEKQEDFERESAILFADLNRVKEATRAIIPLAVADGQQALKVVRANATEWNIAPDRIGIMGFSAGGRVTLGAALEFDAASRPAFAAPIYGALWEEIKVPADAPPLFIAVANDDSIAAEPCLQLFSAWRSANRPVEMHVYSTGGHGFGMKKQGKPSDHWLELLGDWLRLQGFMA